LLSLPNPPSWTIEGERNILPHMRCRSGLRSTVGELRKVDGFSRVHLAEFGHPLSIALQIGLIDVLHSWGIKPDVVLGHSSGEIAAAYASGAITAESAMAAATFRGTSNVSSERKSSIAAIRLRKKGDFAFPRT
jgi:acyl transferase domain-containing protein